MLWNVPASFIQDYVLTRKTAICLIDNKQRQDEQAFIQKGFNS